MPGGGPWGSAGEGGPGWGEGRKEGEAADSHSHVRLPGVGGRGAGIQSAELDMNRRSGYDLYIPQVPILDDCAPAASSHADGGAVVQRRPRVSPDRKPYRAPIIVRGVQHPYAIIIGIGICIRDASHRSHVRLLWSSTRQLSWRPAGVCTPPAVRAEGRPHLPAPSTHPPHQIQSAHAMGRGRGRGGGVH